MIQIEFFKSGAEFRGFEVKGHSMRAPIGKDVVCAAVSSACLMAANTITEIIGLNAIEEAEDAFMRLILEDELAPAQDMIKGLKLHMEELAKSYPKNIRVIISEV